MGALWTIPANTSPLLLSPASLEQSLCCSYPLQTWDGREEHGRNKPSSWSSSHPQGFWWFIVCWNSACSPGSERSGRIVVPFQSCSCVWAVAEVERFVLMQITEKPVQVTKEPDYFNCYSYFLMELDGNFLTIPLFLALWTVAGSVPALDFQLDKDLAPAALVSSEFWWLCSTWAWLCLCDSRCQMELGLQSWLPGSRAQALNTLCVLWIFLSPVLDLKSSEAESDLLWQILYSTWYWEICGAYELKLGMTLVFYSWMVPGSKRLQGR